MRRVLMTVLALSATLAGTAQGGVQQTTEAQRRELEKKIEQLQQEMQELRRQLGRAEEGPRVRVEAGPRATTPRARVFSTVPGMTMFTKKPKFGFSMDNTPDSAGAKVMLVTPGSPAEKAGLRSGDIITMFNGVKLSGLEEPGMEVMKQGENIEIGDTISVEYKRGTERKRIQMVAAEVQGAYAYAYSTEPGATPEPGFKMTMPEMFEFGRIPGSWLDVELVSVNKDLGEYFGATEGVLVIRAPRDSSLGLKAGDVVLSVGGRKATNPAQAIRILRSYENGESFEISVLRQKKRINVMAKVPERDRGYFSWDNESHNERHDERHEQ